MASKRSWSTFGPTFLNGGTGWSSDAAVALLRSTVRNLMKTSERDGEKTASASVAVFELVDASSEGVVGKRCSSSRRDVCVKLLEFGATLQPSYQQ